MGKIVNRINRKMHFQRIKKSDVKKLSIFYCFFMEKMLSRGNHYADKCGRTFNGRIDLNRFPKMSLSRRAKWNRACKMTMNKSHIWRTMNGIANANAIDFKYSHVRLFRCRFETMQNDTNNLIVQFSIFHSTVSRTNVTHSFSFTPVRSFTACCFKTRPETNFKSA